ncbi:Apolipoprotein O [Phaffia rhodozyma]|uniref:MICOS complex subunit n=1 Tax=Phaffia rhodozyma TaxID=264483 RepID=A0A0F7SKQ0_PHARH|nr:Apolipoprotein O [Phaffia rhodozyma]
MQSALFNKAGPLAVGSTLALTGGFVYNQQRKPLLMDEYRRREKLPIYPQPQPEIILVDTFSPLQAHIAVGREATTSVIQNIRDESQKVVAKWVAIERRVANKVKATIPEDEPLTPGIAWVGVSTLAGSIIARNRNILVRALLPPTLLVASLPVFLPKLSENLSSEISRYTLKTSPELHREVSQARAKLFGLTEQSREAWISGKQKLTDSVTQGVDFVDSKTGLQFSQTLRNNSSASSSPIGEERSQIYQPPVYTVSKTPVRDAVVAIPSNSAPLTQVSDVLDVPVYQVVTTTTPNSITTTSSNFASTPVAPAHLSTQEQVDSAAASTLAYLEEKAKEGLASLQKQEAKAETAARQTAHEGHVQANALRAKAQEIVRDARSNAEEGVQTAQAKVGEGIEVARAKAEEGKASLEQLKKEAVEALADVSEKTKEQVQAAKGKFEEVQAERAAEQEKQVILEPLRAHGVEHPKLPSGFKKLI